MSLSTVQLASTSALALLAGSANATPGQSMVSDDLASHRVALELNWKTKRSASDVLTALLDVDGIRVLADRRAWDRPEVLALRHDFAPDNPFYLYCAAGIDRAVYLDSRALTPSSPLSAHRWRSVGAMAEVGASWRLTKQFNVEADVLWMDLARDSRMVRADAGSVSGDPVGLTLSLVWRGK